MMEKPRRFPDTLPLLIAIYTMVIADTKGTRM